MPIADNMNDLEIYKTAYFSARDLLDSAKVEVCPRCLGNCRIYPIENPHYDCDYYDGDGWVSHWKSEVKNLTKEVDRLEREKETWQRKNNIVIYTTVKPIKYGAWKKLQKWVKNCLL